MPVLMSQAKYVDSVMIIQLLQRDVISLSVNILFDRWLTG